MKTRTHQKGTQEHYHQKAFFEWTFMQSKQAIPELMLAFAIPNGGLRHIAVAMKLKAEGLKSGVPDVFIPVPRNGYHGLFLEFKSPFGHLKAQQRTWLNELSIQGYFAYCVHGIDEAIEITSYYFGKIDKPKKLEWNIGSKKS